jgi:hypothetical protein
MCFRNGWIAPAFFVAVSYAQPVVSNNSDYEPLIARPVVVRPPEVAPPPPASPVQPIVYREGRHHHHHSRSAKKSAIVGSSAGNAAATGTSGFSYDRLSR